MPLVAELGDSFDDLNADGVKPWVEAKAEAKAEATAANDMVVLVVAFSTSSAIIGMLSGP